MTDHHDVQADKAAARQPYHPPVLREYGSLADLTRSFSTKTSKNFDGATKGNKFSG